MLAMAVDRENGAAFKVHTQVCTGIYILNFLTWLLVCRALRW
jgi:hypothetical protein